MKEIFLRGLRNGQNQIHLAPLFSSVPKLEVHYCPYQTNRMEQNFGILL